MSENEVPDGYEVVRVPLSAVRYDASSVNRKVYPDGRVTDFFLAEPGQFVRSLDGDSVVWAPVYGYSVHRGISIVIVNLANGCQIITDHDPRAVFGRIPGGGDSARFYPDDALAKGVEVPCRLPDTDMYWGKGSMREGHESLWDAIHRKAEVLATLRLGSRISRESGVWVLTSVDLKAPGTSGELHWSAVESVIYTGQREDGYDLTVPGFETFMSADGVILSNTMSIHLPSTDEAVKDVRERMMPDKMLWSVKDRDKVVPAPKHEQMIGLNLGGTRELKNKHKFANDKDAMHAIETGQVDLNDDIEIDAAYVPPAPTAPVI